MSYIHSIQISFPEHECKQEEIRNLVSSLWPDKHEIIYQFFESTTVKSRNLALPLLDYQKIGHFGDRNNIWKKVALELQKKNIINLFANNSISPNDINLIVSVNSTGLCVPTLDALLMNQFKFNRNLKRLPLFGLGCLGGVAGINRVDDYLSGHPKEVAIILITELCSLTYQLNDCSIPNIVRAALFGDGAAAIMLVGNEHPLSSLSRFKILKSKSYFYPDTEHYMGWKMVESGFEIELSPEIPNLIIEKAGIDVSEFIIECGKIRQDIKFFVAHPGGPKVLNALIESINGTVDDFNLSFESLSEHGNMSSVSVIDVLSKTINKKDLVQGDLGLLLSTGPAFSLDLTLVQKC